LLLHEGFEQGRIGPGWTGLSFNPRTQPPEDSDSFDIVTSPVRKGKYALRITVHPDDAVYPGDRRRDKERCELERLNDWRSGSYRLGNEGREGTEYWYAWSVLIPDGYQYVARSKRSWQIMGQWHDQPDPGQRPTGYSPPISVHYRSSGAAQSLSVHYGLIQRGGPIQVMDAPIEKGKWVDLMFHIRFSRGSDGFLEAWKDGVMLASANGATRITGTNMFNDQPNYLRLGLYRGEGQTQTNSLYYDEIKVATSKADLLGE